MQAPNLSNLLSLIPKPYVEAAKQFVFILLLTLTPVFFSVLLELLKNTTLPNSRSELAIMFLKNFKTGEIFIFTVSLLAPASYVVYKYNRERRKFPNLLSWQFSLFLLIAISAFMFGLQRAEIIRNDDLLNWMYLGVYLSSLAIWYLSILHDENLAFVEHDLRRGEKNMVQELDEFAKGK
ncbi:MAG: hypothetical protein ACK4FJ_02315 [Ferrovibrio sp.]|uniref:hypothetical protein n=1 Tax=Ferrovibrio sp. TaxID=1917215 RepID=UPI00391AEFB4